MAFVMGSSHSDVPNSEKLRRKEKSNVGRKSANYHPSIWGDYLNKLSLADLEPNLQTQQRANELKEEVRRMLLSINGDLLQQLNLIDAIQRLGVAYHFKPEISNALLNMYNAYNDGKGESDDLHAVALRFRLLRQDGYSVSPDVFKKFVDAQGNFKKTFARDIRSLLSLYEAAYLGTPGEDILDEAISFTRDHLKLALPHLNAPLSTLVDLALELPLRKRIERLQSRFYIKIYQEEKEGNEILLEFAILDFNLLQLLHKRELKEFSMWWKAWDFGAKLPFIRDRVVELYHWILGVYFEPQYSRARMILTRMIALTSVMDDIYDVYGTMEELEPYTDAIQRWDRGTIDELPGYMQQFLNSLLDTVDKFDEELTREGKSYRISYLKEAVQTTTLFKDLSKYYFIEMQWTDSGYEPAILDEYMSVASTTAGHFMLTLVSYVGMGDVATKEAFEWAIKKPKLLNASSVIGRLTDDIQSNQLEQMRGHVASCIQICMKEHGCTYEEARTRCKGMAAEAWKDMNKECLKPTVVPMEILMPAVNLARVCEVIYQHRDGYTDSSHETKEHINLLLVDPVPV